MAVAFFASNNIDALLADDYYNNQLPFVRFACRLQYVPPLFERCLVLLFPLLQRSIAIVLKGTWGRWRGYVDIRRIIIKPRNFREDCICKNFKSSTRKRHIALIFLASINAKFIIAIKSLSGISIAFRYKNLYP